MRALRFFSFSFLPLLSSLSLVSATGSVQAADDVSMMTPAPEPSIPLADIHAIRMEKIIEIARRIHPNMGIISTFQEEDNAEKVDKIIYFLPDKREPRIITINSKTGKVMRDRPYHLHNPQSTIPLEKLLADLRKRFDIAKVVRTRIAYRDGQDVRLIIYTTGHKQQRIMTINALTGAVISDKPRNM